MSPSQPGLALVRLLQLASPALPVGAYTYSQGLEWAVEEGGLKGEPAVGQWIGDQLEWNLAGFEAPLVVAAMAAWSAGDDERLARLNGDFLASRETAELRAETVQMGYSLRRLLTDLEVFACQDGAVDRLAAPEEIAYPIAWAAAASSWSVAPTDALTAYLWSWLENQVMAAVKCVPLGQSAGQRLLSTLGERIPGFVAEALASPEVAWSNFAPGLAIASSRHETQYTRLFRS
ncbi:MAG: urease accessory protein UreF [Rhodocyclaceae bacterium]|nr:urease accessory protein UreF [Rhodocyclaceae bacterium]